MSKVLVEFDTGHVYGPCSEENEKKYEEALRRGASFFLYPYCGYSLKMKVSELKREKASPS